jgi:tRNA U38,U39,U40 pseudouridine synthase TruA
MRFRATLAYVGTFFRWQIQGTRRTVQAVLE